MSDENLIARKYINQIRSLFDLISRIDERVKMISDKQNEFDSKMEKYTETHSRLVERVIGLESKNGTRNIEAIKKLELELSQLQNYFHKLEMTLGGVQMTAITQEHRWKVVFDFIVKVGIMIASAIVIYKIGVG